MSNQLFGMYGRNNASNMPSNVNSNTPNNVANINAGTSSKNPFQNFTDTMKAFNQFKSNFSGSPEQIVKGMLVSGQMTQEQYAQLQQMEGQFEQFAKMISK